MVDEVGSQTAPPSRSQESNFNRGRRRQGPTGRGRGRALGGELGGQGRRGRQMHNQRPGPQVPNVVSGEGGQPPGTASEEEGTSGDRSTGDAGRSEGEEKGTITDEPDDGGTCFICASRVEHISVSPCNHRTCHICALRLRALYKNKSCAHCRVWPTPFLNIDS